MYIFTLLLLCLLFSHIQTEKKTRRYHSHVTLHLWNETTPMFHEVFGYSSPPLGRFLPKRKTLGLLAHILKFDG